MLKKKFNNANQHKKDPYNLPHKNIHFSTTFRACCASCGMQLEGEIEEGKKVISIEVCPKCAESMYEKGRAYQSENPKERIG